MHSYGFENVQNDLNSWKQVECVDKFNFCFWTAAAMPSYLVQPFSVDFLQHYAKYLFILKLILLKT